MATLKELADKAVNTDLSVSFDLGQYIAENEQGLMTLLGIAILSTIAAGVMYGYEQYQLGRSKKKQDKIHAENAAKRTIYPTEVIYPNLRLLDIPKAPQRGVK